MRTSFRDRVRPPTVSITTAEMRSPTAASSAPSSSFNSATSSTASLLLPMSIRATSSPMPTMVPSTAWPFVKRLARVDASNSAAKSSSGWKSSGSLIRPAIIAGRARIAVSGEAGAGYRWPGRPRRSSAVDIAGCQHFLRRRAVAVATDPPSAHRAAAGCSRATCTAAGSVVWPGWQGRPARRDAARNSAVRTWSSQVKPLRGVVPELHVIRRIGVDEVVRRERQLGEPDAAERSTAPSTSAEARASLRRTRIDR